MKLPAEMQKFSENNDDVLIEAIVRDLTQFAKDIDLDLYGDPKLILERAMLLRYGLEPKT